MQYVSYKSEKTTKKRKPSLFACGTKQTSFSLRARARASCDKHQFLHNYRRQLMETVVSSKAEACEERVRLAFMDSGQRTLEAFLLASQVNNNIPPTVAAVCGLKLPAAIR